MRVQLKPIEEQVIVITGASSGIGLTTARMAAERGAHVVLCARDGDALARIAGEIRGNGGMAIHCVADVANEEELRRVADSAIRSFGGIDTWVNNAGVGLYGRIDTVPMEDHRKLFETNYWGTVIGSQIAMKHLRDHGGAIINIGSIDSDRSVPLMGHYSATKFAVRAFTDALRMELEASDAPVSVTLVKPGPIDTQFEEHARNHLETEPTHPQPVYAPELVAEAILHAAENPVRDLTVGGGGKLFALGEKFAPRLTDMFMEKVVTRVTRSGGPRRPEGDSLHGPSGHDGEQSIGRHAFVRRTSLYTTAEMHPWTTAAVFAGLGALAVAAYTGRLPYFSGRRADSPRLLEDMRRRRGHYARTGYGEIGHGAKQADQAAEEGEVTFAR